MKWKHSLLDGIILSSQEERLYFLHWSLPRFAFDRSHLPEWAVLAYFRSCLFSFKCHHMRSPPSGSNKEISDGNCGRIAGSDGWLQQKWRGWKEAAGPFPWGVKTQTDLWREKPKQIFLLKHILFFLMYYKNWSLSYLDHFFSDFLLGLIVNHQKFIPGLSCSQRQNIKNVVTPRGKCSEVVLKATQHHHHVMSPFPITSLKQGNIALHSSFAT